MGRKRKYKVNDNKFKTINTEEKAYWLGFLYADGYIHKNKVILELSVKDYSHIEKFLLFLESNNPISITSKNCAKVTITSNQLTDDLKRHGCIERKSMVLKFPVNIDKSLVHHFIRGYFDGDGSIYKCATQNRYEMSILGTEEFLSEIPNMLNITSNKILKSNSRTENRKIKYGGRLKVKNIMDKIYADSNIFLNRKKQIYEELCESLHK